MAEAERIYLMKTLISVQITQIVVVLIHDKEKVPFRAINPKDLTFDTG